MRKLLSVTFAGSLALLGGVFASIPTLALTLLNGSGVELRAFAAQLKSNGAIYVADTQGYSDDFIRAAVDRTVGKFHDNIYLPFVEAPTSGGSQSQNDGSAIVDQLHAQSAKAAYSAWILELEKECASPCSQADSANPQTCPLQGLANQLQGDLSDRINAAKANEPPTMDLGKIEAFDEEIFPSKIGNAIMSLCRSGSANDRTRIAGYITSKY
jgi:hypothetical protein